jgi:hypothetical protein|tara:strand:- start:469 stop:579 length:111 start_codon:yes stop_codon:yes gene_type:complete
MKKKLKKIAKELNAASAMHKRQSKIVKKISKKVKKK